MRSTAALFAVLTVGLALAVGCGGGSAPAPTPTPTPTPLNPRLTIVVTGTKGLEFKGEWKERGVGVHRDNEVEDFVPDRPPRRVFYDAEGPITYLRFLKRQEEGGLRIEIREGDRVLVRMETSEPFGVVSIGAQ